MKALMINNYGSPDELHLSDVAQPAPKENEVLVRVYASSVNFGDILARKFGKVTPAEFNMPLPLYFVARASFGYNKPKEFIFGSEFAGVVEAVGPQVSRFQPGDEVFGYSGQRMSAAAEYITMAEDDEIARKPTNMSFAEAAVIPYGAITALNLLRKADIQPGQSVLILGASGSIGAAAVQLAKSYGAEVTGVCSEPRMEFVQALGADKVIDYTREDFTQNGERYDLIFDILGRSSFDQVRDSLKPNGRYLLASFKSGQLFDMLRTSISGDKKVICAFSPNKTGDLPRIKELIEAGTLTAFIDECFPLAEAAAAHRYVEEGHKKGHIALVVYPNGNGRS